MRLAPRRDHSLTFAFAVAITLVGSRAAAKPAVPEPTASAEQQVSLSAAEQARAQRLAKIHRILQISTASSLAFTGLFLGTIAAINQPTAFGEGRCRTGNPVFGSDYGCGGLSILHGVSAVITVSLYVSTETLDYVRPKLVPERHRTLRRVLRYTHLAGIALTPLLGLMGSRPEWIGVPTGDRYDFSKTVRTIHITIAAITALAYLGTTILED